MALNVSCDGCGHLHGVPENLAGKRIRCHCGAVCRVPAVQQSSRPRRSRAPQPAPFDESDDWEDYSPVRSPAAHTRRAQNQQQTSPFVTEWSARLTHYWPWMAGGVALLVAGVFLSSVLSAALSGPPDPWKPVAGLETQLKKPIKLHDGIEFGPPQNMNLVARESRDDIDTGMRQWLWLNEDSEIRFRIWPGNRPPRNSAGTSNERTTAALMANSRIPVPREMARTIVAFTAAPAAPTPIDLGRAFADNASQRDRGHVSSRSMERVLYEHVATDRRTPVQRTHESAPYLAVYSTFTDGNATPGTEGVEIFVWSRHAFDTPEFDVLRTAILSLKQQNRLSTPKFPVAPVPSARKPRPATGSPATGTPATRKPTAVASASAQITAEPSQPAALSIGQPGLGRDPMSTRLFHRMGHGEAPPSVDDSYQKWRRAHGARPGLLLFNMHSPFRPSSPPGKLFFINDQVWNAETEETVARVDLDGDKDLSMVSTFLAMNADGQLVAYAKSSSADIQIFSTSDNRQIQTIPAPFSGTGGLDVIRFLDNGRLVTADDLGLTKHLIVWDAGTGQRLNELRIQVQERAAYSHDGKFVAADGMNGLAVYDIEKGQRVAKMATPREAVFPLRASELAFSADTSELAALCRVGGDEMLICWNARGKIVYQHKFGFLEAGFKAWEEWEGLFWLPDKSGWLLGNNRLLLRKPDAVVLKLVDDIVPVSQPSMIVDQDHIVGIMQDLDHWEVVKFKIPWREINARFPTLKDGPRSGPPSDPIVIDMHHDGDNFGNRGSGNFGNRGSGEFGR